MSIWTPGTAAQPAASTNSRISRSTTPLRWPRSAANWGRSSALGPAPRELWALDPPCEPGRHPIGGRHIPKAEYRGAGGNAHHAALDAPIGRPERYERDRSERRTAPIE